MKKFIALILAALFVFSAASCADTEGAETTALPDTTAAPEPEPLEADLLDRALGLAKFDNKLAKMPYKYVGYGVFKDYTSLHSFPLNSIKYPTRIASYTKNASADSSGIYELCRSLIANCGYQVNLDSLINYESDASFDAVLEKMGVAGEVSRIDDSVRPAFTEYLSALSFALELNFEATEKITEKDHEKIADFVYCDTATSNYQSLQNAVNAYQKVTWKKLLASGELVVKASEAFIKELSDVKQLTKDGSALTLATLYGNIIFGTAGDDVYTSPEALLIVEIGGNDKYNGTVAASMSLDKPISVLIDLDGNDGYVSTDADNATQGCGKLGTGLLFDLRGDDHYKADHMAQGAAMMGTGLLFDGEGTDEYISYVTSQGAAYYGFAALVDVKGNDRYRATAFSQAAGGNKGMAFLVDVTGDDEYYVEVYTDKDTDPDLVYEQFPVIFNNWSQGCGLGQRNASYGGSSGLSGGIGGMIDHGGNDIYTGGAFVLGFGYWSGVGFVCNIGGNDEYHSQYYSQASSAHYGAGLLVDIGGDDLHALVQPSNKGETGNGASIGFVWDRGIGTFVNDGGNDQYISKRTSCGVAWSAYDEKGERNQDLTYAFFIDTEGDDYYSSSEMPSYGYGNGGFFIDAAGKDEYGNIPNLKNGKMLRDTASGDYGVKIDFTAKEGEIPVIPVWNEAKKLYFGE